mmetsp:Transcript_1999/g.5447  ORF Transcript_1999/g.5447 Transcript_1999/m.5447 type:complete len:207 (-) Transcript_1999:184-804(-)
MYVRPSLQERGLWFWARPFQELLPLLISHHAVLVSQSIELAQITTRLEDRVKQSDEALLEVKVGACDQKADFELVHTFPKLPAIEGRSDQRLKVQLAQKPQLFLAQLELKELSSPALPALLAQALQQNQESVLVDFPLNGAILPVAEQAEHLVHPLPAGRPQHGDDGLVRYFIRVVAQPLPGPQEIVELSKARLLAQYRHPRDHQG